MRVCQTWFSGRVRELRDDGDLTLEPLHAQRRRELWRQDLDHDAPREACCLSDEYARHSSTPELTLESVRFSERSLELFAKIVHEHTQT